MGMFWQDLRYGMRMLVKHAGFTAVAIIALALGIGANTAIFSVVNAVLLRPLPFKDADRIVFINETVRRETVENRPLSYPDFVDWRDQNQSLDQMAAFDTQGFSLTDVDEPERITGEIVSASYFSILGLQAKLGRTFLAEEDSAPDTHPVTVLSYKLWQRRFGADPNLVGRTVKLNERDYTVVGIMPEGFEGISGSSQIWIPMMMISAIRSSNALQARGARWHSAIARLKPGVTLEQAQSDLETIAARLEQAYPGTNKDRGARVVSSRDATVGDIRQTLIVLLAAVAFVLLIACSNVANLLLARATARHKEIAIRTALGASRGRVVRQLLTESVMLALAGGAAGLLIAVWGVDFLTAFLADQLPSFIKPGMDGRVLGFTLLVSVLTGIAFGLLPALQASSPEFNDILKEGGRGSTAGGRRNVRRGIVVAEMAMALVLLVCAGLMLRSFQRLRAFDPGFKVDRIMTMRINLPRRYNPAQSTAFHTQLIERVEALPSVESVSLASDVPLDGNSSATYVAIEGLAPPDNSIRGYIHNVSPNFFATAGIPLLKGRDFTAQDTDQGPRVAIISDSMARRLWGAEDPIGKRISIDEDKDNKPLWDQVVGVVGDVKYRTLIRDQNKDPDLYFPLLRTHDREVAAMIRTSGDSTALVAALRGEVGKLDPNLPVFGARTMQEQVKNETAQARFSSLLLAVFAAVALVLAAVGIYGVMSYSVTQRTHEIGIRMALGAERRDILKLVVGEGLAMVAIGTGLGLAGAFVATRALASQLYGISASDPVTFAAVSLILAGVALGACFVPARRATKVDPMVALRYE